MRRPLAVWECEKKIEMLERLSEDECRPEDYRYGRSVLGYQTVQSMHDEMETILRSKGTINIKFQSVFKDPEFPTQIQPYELSTIFNENDMRKNTDYFFVAFKYVGEEEIKKFMGEEAVDGSDRATYHAVAVVFTKEYHAKRVHMYIRDQQQGKFFDFLENEKNAKYSLYSVFLICLREKHTYKTDTVAQNEFAKTILPSLLPVNKDISQSLMDRALHSIICLSDCVDQSRYCGERSLVLLDRCVPQMVNLFIHEGAIVRSTTCPVTFSTKKRCRHTLILDKNDEDEYLYDMFRRNDDLISNIWNFCKSVSVRLYNVRKLWVNISDEKEDYLTHWTIIRAEESSDTDSALIKDLGTDPTNATRQASYYSSFGKKRIGPNLAQADNILYMRKNGTYYVLLQKQNKLSDILQSLDLNPAIVQDISQQIKSLIESQLRNGVLCLNQSIKDIVYDEDETNQVSGKKLYIISNFDKPYCCWPFELPNNCNVYDWLPLLLLNFALTAVHATKKLFLFRDDMQHLLQDIEGYDKNLMGLTQQVRDDAMKVLKENAEHMDIREEEGQTITLKTIIQAFSAKSEFNFYFVSCALETSNALKFICNLTQFQGQDGRPGTDVLKKGGSVQYQHPSSGVQTGMLVDTMTSPRSGPTLTIKQDTDNIKPHACDNGDMVVSIPYDNLEYLSNVDAIDHRSTSSFYVSGLQVAYVSESHTPSKEVNVNLNSFSARICISYDGLSTDGIFALFKGLKNSRFAKEDRVKFKGRQCEAKVEEVHLLKVADVDAQIEMLSPSRRRFDDKVPDILLVVSPYVKRNKYTLKLSDCSNSVEDGREVTTTIDDITALDIKESNRMRDRNGLETVEREGIGRMKKTNEQEAFEREFDKKYATQGYETSVMNSSITKGPFEIFYEDKQIVKVEPDLVTTHSQDNETLSKALSFAILKIVKKELTTDEIYENSDSREYWNRVEAQLIDVKRQIQEKRPVGWTQIGNF